MRVIQYKEGKFNCEIVENKETEYNEKLLKCSISEIFQPKMNEAKSKHQYSRLIEKIVRKTEHLVRAGFICDPLMKNISNVSFVTNEFVTRVVKREHVCRHQHLFSQ